MSIQNCFITILNKRFEIPGKTLLNYNKQMFGIIIEQQGSTATWGGVPEGSYNKPRSLLI